MEEVNPLMADMLAVGDELGVHLAADDLAQIDSLISRHEMYRGPQMQTSEIRRAGSALRILAGALREGMRAPADPAMLPGLEDEEALALVFVEMRIVLAADLLLTIAKLMELDPVPIFGHAPVVRSLLEVATLAVHVLRPVASSGATTASKDQRELLVARHLNERVRRLRGIDRRTEQQDFRIFLDSHFSQGELDDQEREQAAKLERIYQWAQERGVQRVTNKGNASEDGIYLVEPPLRCSGRVARYFGNLDAAQQGLDGSLLGAHQYERLSLISHGDPDSVEANLTDAGGVGLRIEDYRIVFPVSAFIDAVHSWQLVALGPGWETPLVWRAIEALTIRRLMRVDDSSG